jgi:DNA-binding XRE family transcriptional regulator
MKMKIAKDHDHGRVDTEEAALTMAIAVLVERIRSLPKEDKEDLFELSQALWQTDDEEEIQSIAYAFQEILSQEKARVQPFPDDEDLGKLQGWLSFVSERIKEARREARLTQEELEQKTGLPQSHISRLENGVHSPSTATLEKIAKATGKPMTHFDPCHQDEQ